MRLEALAAEEMSDRQRELADRISARRGAVRGPYRVWLRSPELCDHVEALGAFARFGSSLPEHRRLLCLLVACRAFDSPYSWTAHVDQAVAAGISPEVIDAIARLEVPVFEDETDQAFYDFCAELCGSHFVAENVFDRAYRLLGETALVDAVGTLGNFTMLAMCLNAFEIDLQPDRRPPFPDMDGYRKNPAAQR